MKKVLVTGGSGYLGARICQYLDKQGYFVTAFDRSAPVDQGNWLSSNSEVLIGDITEIDVIDRLSENDYDVVIHLVSLDHHESEQEPEKVAQINVMPAWNLLNRFSKKGLKTFIYFSTVHVYGRLEGRKIIESSSVLPRNAYALTHLMTENICDYYNKVSSINCINLRLSNSYGSPLFSENNCWWLVMNDLCRSAFYKKKISILSDGSPRRDFIHSSDICRTVEYFVNNTVETTMKNTYNLSSGISTSIYDLARTIKKIFKSRYGENIPIELKGEPIQGKLNKVDSSMDYAIDNTALQCLGLSPRTSIEDGIHELLEYFEQNNDSDFKI